MDAKTLKKRLAVSHVSANAILRGMQLTLVGAYRALQNPTLFSSDHYKQAAVAVVCGIAIKLLIALPILFIKTTLWFISLFWSLDSVTWDDALIDALDFLSNYVLQVPFLLMTIMRYVVPTLDNLFMDSLKWVDLTYTAKHRGSPDELRPLYYPNLVQYDKLKDHKRKESTSSASALRLFLYRFGRRGLISVLIFSLSYLPIFGRFVLPLASFYTFKRAVGYGPAISLFLGGLFVPRRYLVVFLQTYFSSRNLMRELLVPYFARIQFTQHEKKHWFRNREGVLFGFGLGFYFLVRVPLLGVLIYGIAEASTAYLITKVTDPPPPPSESRGFAATQEVWHNEHHFLNLPVGDLDAMHGGINIENKVATREN